MFGFLFGCMFPLVSTPIAANFFLASVTLEHLIEVQLINPLMWVIDTSPFVLGVFSWFAGRKQDQLQELIENQEHLINGQTASLRHALSVAQTADKIKSRFLANMSHELRTPLNAIIGFSQIIQENVKHDNFQDLTDLENLSEDAERIESAGKHLLSLVNTILDFSKAEAGELVLHPTEFELSETIEDTLEMIMPSLEQKNLVLNYTISPEQKIIVSGDASKFKQVVINLITNAIKFTEYGSIKLEVRAKVEPSQTGTLPLARITAVVSDTGIGISPENIQKVLQPFHQADSSVQRKYGGTGLGLSISQQMCRLMDGDIEIESRGLGEGTTVRFWVYMPCLVFEGSTSKISLPPI